MGKPSDLLQGTLDLLILRTIADQPIHGWGIAKRIEAASRNVLQITQGSLYPALYRLERAGVIRSQWKATETGRQARLYALTGAGRGRLEAELTQWARLSTAVSLVVRPA